jgi:phosphonate metabolism protein (transferase hexapeptide repeat family)
MPAGAAGWSAGSGESNGVGDSGGSGGSGGSKTTAGESSESGESDPPVTVVETPGNAPTDTRTQWAPFTECLLGEVDRSEMEITFEQSYSAVGQAPLDEQGHISAGELVMLAAPGTFDVLRISVENGTNVYRSFVGTLASDGDVDDLRHRAGETVGFVDRLSTSGSLFVSYPFERAGLDIREAPYGDPAVPGESSAGKSTLLCLVNAPTGGLGLTLQVEQNTSEVTNTMATVPLVVVVVLGVETISQRVRSRLRRGDDIDTLSLYEPIAGFPRQMSDALLRSRQRPAQPSTPVLDPDDIKMKHIDSYDGFSIEQLGEEPTIHPTARITDSDIGVWTRIGEAVRLTETRFGDYSYIVRFGSAKYTDIGKFCSIAAFVRLNPSNHPMDRPTQHHMTYRRRRYAFDDEDDDTVFEWRRDQPVEVGHDVWIGHNATVMPGVTIGNGAVVASGAVVTHDVEPYTVVGGVPAEPIRRRFSAEIAAELESIAWWDWSRTELEGAFADLCEDVETFIAKYGSAPVASAEDSA